MVNTLRTRLRALVATAICALVVAPALVATTTSTAGAAPPGINTATLTVNGQGTGVASGLGTNPWHFDGGGYTELQAELKSAQNFGPNGIFKKGSFAVPTNSISGPLSFPGNLSGLDVFFAGLPTTSDPYSGAELTALQAFNADGRALVLNANDIGFGEVASFLGFTMRGQRAFFGTDPVCGWTNAGSAFGGGESAPSDSMATGSHPIHDGPFNAAPRVANYHTVQVFTSIPGTAQPLYTLSTPTQQPQLFITGPIGETTSAGTHVSYQAAIVSGNVHITTAALSPASIASVSFFHDDANVPGNIIGSADTTWPYEADWDVAAVADGLHPIIARVTRTPAAGGGTFDVSLQFGGVNVDNTPPVDPNTANITLDCPGAQDQVENTIANSTTVAVIPKGALSANSGPIVVTSDLDMMSNAFGNWSQNRSFTLNAFAWVMDQMLPDVPDDTYFALPNPTRVYDSRLPTPNPFSHAETRAIQVAGVGGVPADAKTLVANVTVAGPTSSGYLTVFPTGQPQPNTSTHNFDVGENFANMVTMQIGNGGYISVFAFLNAGSGSADVIVDVVGYTRRDNSGTRLHTIPPGRLLDTRNNIGLPGAFGAGNVRNLTVRGGTTGVPNDAQSVVLNMTVTDASTHTSFVTVWPTGESQPNVSNINNIEGFARPNLVVARVGAGGQISIVNDSGTADIIADVVGYFSPGAYKSGGVITGLQPSRIVDTRPNNPFTSGQVRSYTVAGAGGIPGTAKTAILKVTAVSPTGGGYVTVWPAGSANPPNVSNLNFGPDMTIPNLVVTQIGAGGQINVFNSAGIETHILIDVLGYAD